MKVLQDLHIKTIFGDTREHINIGGEVKLYTQIISDCKKCNLIAPSYTDTNTNEIIICTFLNH